MKKIILALMIIIATSQIRAESTKESLKKAQDLLEQYKFASAFNELIKADHNDSIPEIQLAKESIALQYFIKSYDHLKFSLRDLPPGESLDEIRDSVRIVADSAFPAVVFSFEIDSVLKKIILKDSTNCSLFRGLADYYYDVASRFEHWRISQTELHELAIENYIEALNGGCKDFKTYYNLGLLHLQNNNLDLGIDAMRHARDLDTDNADASYNLAFAYATSNNKDSAKPFTEASFRLYKDSIAKADAARILGDIYEYEGKDSEALHYLKVADALDPNNYYTIKAMLYFYIRRESPELPNTSDRFFAVEPDNPGIYNDLYDVYKKYGKLDELLTFYQGKLQIKSLPVMVKASIEFGMARIYITSGDKANAKKYWIEARNDFAKELNPKAQVFEIIDDALKSLEGDGK